jgi:hypothetical protein
VLLEKGVGMQGLGGSTMGQDQMDAHGTKVGWAGSRKGSWEEEFTDTIV